LEAWTTISLRLVLLAPCAFDGLDSPAARIELLMDLGPEVYGTDPETGERIWLRGAGLLSKEQVASLLSKA
jgi:hypothetical protein